MKAKFIFIALLTQFQAYLHAQSPSGTLDSTFNFDGMQTTSMGIQDDQILSSAIQTDGKIIVAGIIWNGSNYDIGLARYNVDGSLDNSFGVGGKVITTVGVLNDFANSVLMQSDGKIIVGGCEYIDFYSHFLLVRYNSDGTLDDDFGVGGFVTTEINHHFYDRINSIALQPDGKIVCGGYTWNGVIGDFALARYNFDGTLDGSFGLGGIVTTDFGTTNDGINSIAIQLDGRIVAAGYTSTIGTSSNDFAVARYNEDGNLDVSFNGDGKIITHIDPDTREATTVAVQSDGKILVGGCSGIDATGNYDFALVRYDTIGGLDPSFNGDGIVTTEISTGWDWIRSIILQPDQKIIAAGFGNVAPNNAFVLTRYLYDGSIDTTFGDSGIVITDFGIYSDNAYSVNLQLDGKIIAAGNTYNGSDYDFALARYFSGIVLSCDSIISEPGDILAEIGSNVIFVINVSSDSVTFQWQAYDGAEWISLTDGGQFSGVNDDTLNVLNVTVLNDNQLFKCIISTKNCVDTSSYATLSIVSLEINEINDNDIHIYPNPTSEFITINAGPIVIQNFRIFNSLGKLIYTGTDQNLKLNIQSYPPGAYLINILTINGLISKVIIKD